MIKTAIITFFAILIGKLMLIILMFIPPLLPYSSAQENVEKFLRNGIRHLRKLRFNNLVTGVSGELSDWRCLLISVLCCLLPTTLDFVFHQVANYCIN